MLIRVAVEGAEHVVATAGDARVTHLKTAVVETAKIGMEEQTARISMSAREDDIHQTRDKRVAKVRGRWVHSSTSCARAPPLPPPVVVPGLT